MFLGLTDQPDGYAHDGRAVVEERSAPTSWTRASDMSSFASIGTALSALRYNRVAMDIASQNIANVGTEGYTCRRIETTAAGTPTVPALWSRTRGRTAGC